MNSVDRTLAQLCLVGGSILAGLAVYDAMQHRALAAAIMTSFAVFNLGMAYYFGNIAAGESK